MFPELAAVCLPDVVSENWGFNFQPQLFSFFSDILFKLQIFNFSQNFKRALPLSPITEFIDLVQKFLKYLTVFSFDRVELEKEKIIKNGKIFDKLWR